MLREPVHGRLLKRDLFDEAVGAGLIGVLGERAEVYIHDIYTAPDRRRHGIASAGSRLLYPMLAAEGLSRVVGSCLPENRTGWQSVVSAGFRPCGKIGYVRLGPWRPEFCTRRPL